jgi:CDGSH-type Zn-finger protein
MPSKQRKTPALEAITMKKLLVLSAIAVLAACGGSDNKPATDPTTTNSTPAGTSTAAADPAKAPATPSTGAAPASTDAAKPADPTKK